MIHEAVTAPLADWEPYATGGDWRRALHAWYTAETDRLVNYQRRENEAFVASIGLPLDNSGLSPFLARQLDYTEAWYRAPLAAAGDNDDDWLCSFAGRIETWPDTSDGWNGRTAWLARLRDNEFAHSM